MLTLGVHSPALARTAGQRLPMYPAKGYSLTFPIREGRHPPMLGGVDEATLVAWANFGDRPVSMMDTRRARHDDHRRCTAAD